MGKFVTIKELLDLPPTVPVKEFVKRGVKCECEMYDAERGVCRTCEEFGKEPYEVCSDMPRLAFGCPFVYKEDVPEEFWEAGI